MKQRRVLSRILFSIFILLVVLSACNNPQPTTPSLIKGNVDFNKNGFKVKDESCSTSSAIANSSDLMFIQPNGNCQNPSLPLQIESPIGRPRVSYLSSDSTTISVNPYPLAIINFDWDGHSYSTARLNNDNSSLIFAYYGLGLACDSCSGSISEEDRYDGKYITVTFGGKTKPYSNPYSCSEVGEYIKLDSFSATFKVSCEKPIPTPIPTITPTPEPSPTNECGGNGNSGGGGFGTKSINNNGILLPSDITPLISSAQNLLSPLQDVSDKSVEYNKISNQINNTQNQLNILLALPSTKSRELKKQEIQNKLNGFISQKDGLTQQINSSLTNLDTQRNNLRALINSITTSQDTTDKLNNLQDYKDRIEELEAIFDNYVYGENTYSIVSADNTLADESKLYADLVRDYTSNLLSNSMAETLTDDPDLTNLDKNIKPIQVIHYLNNRIKSHNNKLFNRQQKIYENFLTLFNKAKISKANFYALVARIESQTNTFHTKNGIDNTDNLPTAGEVGELFVGNGSSGINKAQSSKIEFQQQIIDGRQTALNNNRAELESIKGKISSGEASQLPPAEKKALIDRKNQLQNQEIPGNEADIKQAKANKNELIDQGDTAKKDVSNVENVCQKPCITDSNSNSKGKSLEDILVGAVRDPNSKIKQYIKQGSSNQGNKDFEDFVGNKGEVKMTGKGPLRFEKLKDHPTEPAGTDVNFRDFSKHGDPTLEINFPSGKKHVKIRYE